MSQSVVYLGQQSWLLHVNDTNLLIDPMLLESFGHHQNLRFEIFPPRTIRFDQMPKIDGIVITNEHLDHFHPQSLQLLSKNIPVFMPELFPSVCVREVGQMGFQVELLRHGQAVRVGEAMIRLYQSSPLVPVWESRAASLYVEPVNGDRGIFIQSDTFVDQKEVLDTCKPDVFITTHNGQIVPEGHLGAWDNLLPLASDRPLETTGIEVLQEILSQGTQLFPDVRWILFSGGGYRQVPVKHGPFLWGDYKELEFLANSLRLNGPQAVGLLPGEAAEFSTDLNRHMVEWVDEKVSIADAEKDLERVPSFHEIPPIFDELMSLEKQELIFKEFQDMTPLLMISRLGHHFVNTNFYLDEHVGPHRFAVYLRGFQFGQSDSVLALNINRAKFEWIDVSLKDALYTIPFGIDVNASDLCAVFEGRINIWELATSRMRQWYVSNAWESPVAFLYSYLSEQIRPDLAEKLYKSLRAQ